MLFNSHLFIFIFLPLAILCHDLVSKKPKLRQLTLLLSSLIFYFYWSAQHGLLLLFSLIINYFIGEWLLNKKKRHDSLRTPLTVGLIFNLGLLGLFKYTDFLFNNLGFLFHFNHEDLNWILPLGISFYTFQQISYLLDIQAGFIKERTFLTYMTYVSFFPQLIAGPIVRYTDVFKPLTQTWGSQNDWTKRCQGLFIFSIGLSKKLIIADSIAPYVDQIHTAVNHGHQPAFFEAWFVTLAYPLQLYFDFSGYSDMAYGLALMFGITITQNFNAPFKAKNMSDFWQRWHISLSQCFQRYLFNPLAMSLRHSTNIWLKQIFPFLFTMTLIGFWHGAGWTYIIWGCCHGIFLAIAYLWKMSHRKLPSPLSWSITFISILLVFIWFRASTVESALTFFKSLIGMNGIVFPSAFNLGESSWYTSSYYLLPALEGTSTALAISTISLVWGIAFFTPNSIDLGKKFNLSKKYFLLTVSLLFISCLKINEVSVFLYYQF